jgi:light-regulated signal transduction histidine kinase (bacteriophytochrome)
MLRVYYERDAYGNLRMVGEPIEPVRGFCAQKRNTKESACYKHYVTLLESPQGSARPAYRVCPYGLVTTAAIRFGEKGRVYSGLWIDGVGDSQVPAAIADAARVSSDELEMVTAALEQMGESVRAEELVHFEAALHDARHLNQAIAEHAERLLDQAGYKLTAVWDKRMLQRDELARRYLSIYNASRDLSAALLMEEISRNPELASQNTAPVPLHRLFTRQFQVASERLDKAGIGWRISETQAAPQLSGAFRLIPKILVDNALKYGSRNSDIQVTFVQSEQFLIIECTNFGPVVGEDETDKMFLKGVRGSNKSGTDGHGLGLWLAKTIVEANAGLIDMKVLQRGSDFAGRRLGETKIRIRLLGTAST